MNTKSMFQKWNMSIFDKVHFIKGLYLIQTSGATRNSYHRVQSNIFKTPENLIFWKIFKVFESFIC